MLNLILLILGAIALLYLGAELLVRGAGSLAVRLGLPPMVAGLTVVGFATSTPELVVSVKAALASHGDIAVGNVIGANIFNVAVILGLTALVCPFKADGQALRFHAPLMVSVALLSAWVLYDRAVTRVEGGILLGLLVLYTGTIIRTALRNRETPEALAKHAGNLPRTSKHPALDLAFIGVGIALLTFGSRWLVEGSVAVASAYGISEGIIGLTIVAVGTSTPELAASLVAAFRKHPDIALGNIVGSSIFNILCILGVTGLITPVYAPGVSMTNVAVMTTFAVALVPMLRSGGTLDRTEGGCLVLGYLVYLYSLSII